MSFLNKILSPVTKIVIKKSHFLQIIFLFILVAFIPVLKSSYFYHWSTVLDMDINLIYNSLLVGANKNQLFIDHPAYIPMVIHSIFFKLAYFLNISEVGNLNDLLQSSNKDLAIQKLFNIAQIIHVFYGLLLLFFINKILFYFTKDKAVNFILTLILLFSYPFIDVLDVLRAEILSIILCFIYFIFLERSLSKNGYINILCSGVFFTLALLAKVQVIFCLYSFLLIFLAKNFNNKVFYKEKINLNTLLMILISVYFIFLIIFAVTNFFPKYIDKYFFVFIFLNYCSVFIFFEIKKNTHRAFILLPMIYFSFGCFLPILIFEFFSFFGLVSFYPSLPEIISNPVSSAFSILSGYEINKFDKLEYISYMINHIKTFFRYDFLYNPLSLITYFISILVIFFNIYKKKYSNLFFITILILIITVMNFILGLRYVEFYLIYSLPFNLILLAFIAKDIFYPRSYAISIFVFYLFFSYSQINTSLMKSGSKDNMDSICLKENIESEQSYMRFWIIHFDAVILREICNSFFDNEK